MKIYLFSQALDNKSEDDWFEVEGQKPIRMHDENKTAFVHNKIFELCSTMEILAENDLKIFHFMKILKIGYATTMRMKYIQFLIVGNSQ